MTEIRCPACERPVADGHTLCSECGGRLIAELLAVPGLVDDWTTTRAGLARLTNERAVGRAAETALPVQSIARDVREGEREDPVGATLRGDRARSHLDTAVGGWARVIAEELGVEIPIGARGLVQLVMNGRMARRDGPPAVAVVRWFEGAPVGPPQPRARVARRGAESLAEPASPIEQAAIWLACNPRVLRTHSAAGDILADITGATEAVRRVIDLPVERRYLGPCPHCSGDLRAAVGETWVRCRGCLTQYPVSELEDAARASAAHRLYTAYELVRVLPELGAPIAKTTLYRWIRARKLVERGWMDRARRITTTKHHATDTAVYRAGDAMALAKRDEDEGGSAA
ncbi:hypothetical protein [Nocardia acidivorans]|uniref:hypothetical protein n=1 Tax=Nocardia acidivorans TaxID=404580 RepID=UPI000836808A|nr:hypothetical protein [Nocardia acidivorans]